jgi:hypothetical protein
VDISETSQLANVFEMKSVAANKNVFEATKNVAANKKQQNVAVVNEHRQSSLVSKLHKPGKSRKSEFVSSSLKNSFN